MCKKCDEARRALQDISARKAAGENEMNVDCIKDAGHVVLQKAAGLYTQCLKTASVADKQECQNRIIP